MCEICHSGVECLSGSQKTPHACSADKSQKGAPDLPKTSGCEPPWECWDLNSVILILIAKSVLYQEGNMRGLS